MKKERLMMSSLLQLIVLFFVIFDPPASFAVFITGTHGMKEKERTKIASLAILVAAGLSFAVLLLGQNLLNLFNTTLDEFRVAGGIILVLLGIKMALGHSLTNKDAFKKNSGRAIASIIGTPLLTGPAAITAILVSIYDYGRFQTGLAVAIVLFATALLFYQAKRVHQFMGETSIQVISTILGMVILAWGVKFIITGLKA